MIVKKFLIIPLFFMVSCYAPNIPDKLTEISLIEKIKVSESSGKYPSVFINENGNGFITWDSLFTGARRVENFHLTDDEFKLGNDFGTSRIYLNSKGDGISVWYSYPKAGRTMPVKISFYGRALKNYQPFGDEIILSDDVGQVYLYPKVKIDENGNGLIGWQKNSQQSDIVYSTQIKNFRIIQDTTKRENISSLFYYFKKEQDNLTIGAINPPNIESPKISQINSFKIDEEGNGVITRLDENNNLLAKKVINYNLQDEEIKLTDGIMEPYQVDIDKKGNGLVIWIDDDSNLLRRNFNKFTFEGDVQIIDKINNISVGTKSNLYFFFNSKGKGIITWSELNPSKINPNSYTNNIYAKQIEK